MAAVRHKNSKAEMALRTSLFARGLRYRLHRRDLLGKPDLVFPGQKVVVFVDGDYWHGRAIITDGESAFRQTMRTDRAEWWVAKLKRNVARDAEVTQALRTAGWIVLRFWESDVLASLPRITRRIERMVKRRYRSL